ncbi:MAG: sulfatase [Bacteroidales bacterium]|nr:sulfatase [Bacteroidales bacterium]
MVVSIGLIILLAGCNNPEELPNVIIIFADDQGYNDLGCFGSQTLNTPIIDQMAMEGMMFTSFYAACICSPSRAALLTGCYAPRAGLPDVHIIGAPFGLDTSEITIAEVLKEKNYTTAAIGKWHLGEYDMFGPNRQGFDYFYGTRIVNGAARWEHFAVPLYRNEEIITTRPDHSQFTQNFTREALAFIEKNQNEPFFLYLAHLMPHVPIYPSDNFRGQSGAGLYGDAISEIDWSTGQILSKLKELNIDKNTLIIYTSDNGPWAGMGEQSGSANPLKGSKLSTWEGGVRVPCIMRWPDKIPANTECADLVTTMDILPTLANLTGCSVPADRIIDGKNIWPLMSARPDAKSPHEVFYYYAGTWLQAVKSGKWKLHLARTVKFQSIYGECEGWFTTYADTMSHPQLFNLELDIGENQNVAHEYPDIVEQLERLADKAREDIGDYDRQGANSRPMGYANPDYPIARDWISSPDQEKSTEAMLKEMRVFQNQRFKLLKDSMDLHSREKEELDYYIENAHIIFQD